MLLAGLATWGCPAGNDNPCAGTTCDEGFVCVATEGRAVCAPPVNPCIAKECAAAERCQVGADGLARCVARDLCLGVTCEAGKGCDPATGLCTRDVSRCLTVVCGPGEECDPATGECGAVVDRCAGVCCDTNELCNPATGDCAPDLCDDPEVSCQCGPSQRCEGLTGRCIDVPGPCGVCATSQFCDLGTGRCVTIESGTPADGKVGAGCTSAADCGLSGAEKFCISDGGLFGAMPGGMCSASCNQVACPSGAGCINFGIGEICLDLCLANTDCRDGFECLAITANDTRRYCFPRGATGSACTGTECRPVGSACGADDECVRGATCRLGLAGGYCIMANCRNTDCDDTRESCWCLGTGDCAGSTIAVGKCDLATPASVPGEPDRAQQECRAGYSCFPLRATGTDGYCFARACEADFDCRVTGDACAQDLCDAASGRCDPKCTADADCRGDRACDTSTGRCFTPCRLATDNCGPDGVCDTNLASATARRCVRRCVNDVTCEGSEYCDGDSGRCVPKCAVDSQCTGGRVCNREGRCQAPCDADADCAGASYCEAGRCLPKCSGQSGCSFGEACHAESGRCFRDLTQTLVGGACHQDGDCGLLHATCLTGGQYPGGYCTALGCSAQEPCGSGAACVGDDEDARCLKSCRPDVEGDCRTGYACEARGELNVCVPAL